MKVRPTAGADVCVESVDLTICALPLPHPVVLGQTTYRTRDVAVLRLRSEDGLTGLACGYTRGTPVSAAFEAVAPTLVGVDPWRRGELLEGVRASFLHGAAAFVRALSLVDIALHDLAAKAAGVPLWQLLGGTRCTVPALAVAGYFADHRMPREIEDEVMLRAEEGYGGIKLVLQLEDLSSDLGLVERIRGQLPDSVGLAVDLHGAATSVRGARMMIEPLEALGLLFVEDPFKPDRVDATARLARSVGIPVAAGEDVGGLADYARLSGAVEVVRVDATAAGGVTTALAGAELASVAGAAVVPHVWEHVHAQLAGARAVVEFVERIPTDSGADPLDLLGIEPLELRDGSLVLPSEAGLGFALDDEAVAEFRIEQVTAGNGRGG